jgi:putative transposase
MARPLRIEFEGACYHVMARGNARQAIFLDDSDRGAFVDNLGRVAERLDWRVWAWCLMDNHYHLLLETLQPTLSRGMREVNGVYTQAFNRRHRRVGHLLQGRYKAILVDRDAYLLELSRYIVLNPVRAGLVERVQDFRWSSYRAVMGKAPAPGWLAVDSTLEQFHSKRGPARRAYARFVNNGADATDPYESMQRAGFLGGEEFIERMLSYLDGENFSPEIVRKNRPAASLQAIANRNSERDVAIIEAYKTGAYTITEIANFFGLHRSTASRIARRHKESG